jgi:hypothetical protein
MMISFIASASSLTWVSASDSAISAWMPFSSLRDVLAEGWEEGGLREILVRCESAGEAGDGA